MSSVALLRVKSIFGPIALKKYYPIDIQIFNIVIVTMPKKNIEPWNSAAETLVTLASRTRLCISSKTLVTHRWNIRSFRAPKLLANQTLQL